MKTKNKELQEVEIIKSITCDSCGKSCKTEMGFEYLSMETHWGYGSNFDLEYWDAQVCEECVVSKLEPIIKFKKREYLATDGTILGD